MRYLLVPNGEVIVELATYLGEAATGKFSSDLYIRGECGKTGRTARESRNPVLCVLLFITLVD